MSQNVSDLPELNILLISNDDFLLRVYRRLFMKYGHQVFTETRPQAALQFVSRNLACRPINLVFVDFKGFGLTLEWFTSRLQTLDKEITVCQLPTTLLSGVKDILDRLSH